MLHIGDYVIIALTAVAFLAAIRHVLKSWSRGTCPGCGKCGRPSASKKCKIHRSEKEDICC